MHLIRHHTPTLRQASSLLYGKRCGLSSGTVDCFMARRLCGIRRPIYMWAGEKLLDLAWSHGRTAHVPHANSPTCTEWIPAPRRRRRSRPSASVAALLRRRRGSERCPAFRALLRRRRGGGGHSDHASAPSASGVRLVFVAGGSELSDSEVYFYFTLVLLDRLFLPPAIACRRTESVPPSSLHLQFCDNPP